MTPKDAWERQHSARLAEVRRVFVRRLVIGIVVVGGLGLLVGFFGAVLR